VQPAYLPEAEPDADSGKDYPEGYEYDVAGFHDSNLLVSGS
jgi:hypothetical protein